MTDKYQLQTVARSLDCLAVVERSNTPLSLTELAEAMGESTAIVYRMVCTLEAKGYLYRRPHDKRYAYTGRSMGHGAVTRAVDVLQRISDRSPAGATTAELARDAALEMHVVEELLKPLQDKGLIEPVAQSDRWRLSFALLALARPLLNSSNLTEFLKPVMEKLHAQTGETVSLFYRVDARQVVASAMPSTHPVRYALDVGRAFPLYLGAAGKAALSVMSDDEIDGLLRDDEADAAATDKPDPARLREELAAIRRTGYAVSSGERVEGASAVAVPVTDVEGQPLAVLGLMMPTFRTTAAELERLGQHMISQLRAIPIPAGLGVSNP